MAVSTPIGTYRNNLVTDLKARSNLSGVAIFKFPPVDDAPEKEYIFVADERSDIDRLAFGNKYDENFVINITCYATRAGAGDSVAADARDRCVVFLNEIIDAINDDPTQSCVLDSRVASYEADHGVNEYGRYTVIEITVAATATLQE